MCSQRARLVAGGFIVTGAAGGAGIDGGGPPLPVRVLGGMESKSGVVELLVPAIGIVGSRRSISARISSGRSSMIEYVTSSDAASFAF